MHTHLPVEEAVRLACGRASLSSRGLRPLRRHATDVFLLPNENAIARVRPDTDQPAVRTSIALTRWLTSHRFPAVEPLDVAQPVDVAPHTITFWVYYPQPDRPAPSTRRLGELLRHLHALPPPPVPLPPYRPLRALQDTVRSSNRLSPAQRAWLLERADYLLAQYDQLEFSLGTGLIHADAYPGNTLWDGTLARLGDWDEAALGPRECDLAPTFQGVRFGRTAEDLDDFTHAYGYDPSTWAGLPTLTAMRDLHTLGSFIRRADQGDRVASAQLAHRLHTLNTGRTAARWDSH